MGNQPWENLGRWYVFTETSSAAIYWSWLGNLNEKLLKIKFFPGMYSLQ